MHSNNERVHSPNQDLELERKVKKACEKTSENIHIVSNEPSLACYRLQEHIRKTLPQIVEKRFEVNQVQKQLQGKCYDLEYSISAVKSIESSQKVFQTVQELMKSSIFTKQQLAYEESQSASREKKTPLSMYQRFSGSFDLHSSFLPNTAPISSSNSASGSFVNVNPSNTKLGSSTRRARASSVSSSPSNRRASFGGGTASLATTPKHTARTGVNRSKISNMKNLSKSDAI